MSLDVRATVVAGGHGSGQAAEVAERPEGASYALRPYRLPECPFCEHRAADLRPHIALMHRERVAAAKAYEDALARGASLEVARIRYNAIVRAAVEGGPGHYRRLTATLDATEPS